MSVLNHAQFQKILGELRALNVETSDLGALDNLRLADPVITALLLAEHLAHRLHLLEQRVNTLERKAYDGRQ